MCILIKTKIPWRRERLPYFVAAVQLLSRVQLSTTPWTTVWRASPSSTISQSLLKLMSIESHWVCNAIQPFHPLSPLFSCPQSFPASGSLPMSRLFNSGGQSILTLSNSRSTFTQSLKPHSKAFLRVAESHWLCTSFAQKKQSNVRPANAQLRVLQKVRMFCAAALGSLPPWTTNE